MPRVLFQPLAEITEEGRMNKIGKAKIILCFLAGSAILGIISYGILSLPPFGGEIFGERLERVQANPQFKDGPLSMWNLDQHMLYLI